MGTMRRVYTVQFSGLMLNYGIEIFICIGLYKQERSKEVEEL